MQAENNPNPAASDRNWMWWLLAFWLLGVAGMVAYKWGGIYWFALGDTDDNMRYAQVRAWLDKQGWYDLRQYRLNPPIGASIHWTRLVDLPIAALMLVLRPLLGQFEGDKWACAIAPMIPMALALYGLAQSARRLIAPGAFPIACALLFCAQATLLMFMPLRIDHHGWQLAFLILLVSAAAHPDQRRGGIVAGLAIAASLTIGLEMLPYIAVACAGAALRWVADRNQAERMRWFGLSLGGGALAGFALFASYDNRALVCDVLSPVYLAVAVTGGALFWAMSRLRSDDWRVRLAAAVASAAILAGGFALAFPQCLGRPEHISPELERLWFVNVREAKPLYQHGWRIAVQIAALPVIGAIGGAWATWRARGTTLLAPWATALLMAAFSCGLLFWQTRAGPAAQLLAIPGVAWLAWTFVRPLSDHRWMAVRVLGTVAGFLLVSGLAVPFLIQAVPNPPEKGAAKVRSDANDKANRYCPTLPALRPIGRLPAATILTFVDLGPRLIAVTHHDAIAGPYHRNGDAILDIHHAFRGTPETAHEVMVRHGATLLLLCPGMNESTVYMAQAKQGFYARMMRGQVPAWLTPVPLPKGSPFRLWRRTDLPPAPQAPPAASPPR